VVDVLGDSTVYNGECSENEAQENGYLAFTETVDGYYDPASENGEVSNLCQPFAEQQVVPFRLFLWHASGFSGTPVRATYPHGRTMSNNKQAFTAFILAFLFSTPGCQTPSNDGVDASSGNDVRDSSGLDTVQEDVDGDTESNELDSDGADSNESLFEDTSRWMNERTCEGVVEYPDVDDAFSVPDRPAPTLDRIKTADEVAAETPDDAVSYAVLAGADLNPGADTEYDLYSTGGDATFHLYISNPQNADARDT
jgi:hypothetical protein